METVESGRVLRLKKWTAGGWVVVLTGDNPRELKARAGELELGDCGDGWTIDCERHPNTITYYGCGLCEKEDR